MFIIKKGHQPGVYVPLRALFLVFFVFFFLLRKSIYHCICTRTGLSLRFNCGLHSEAKH